MAETVPEKAARLLLDGRLEIRRVDPYGVFAVCHGDHDSYRLGWSNGWYCRCPSVGPCSHLAALQRVVRADPPADELAAEPS